MNEIRKEPRLRDGNQYQNIPDGNVCGDCKNFVKCLFREDAICHDQTCAFIPSNFAQFGEESEAERSNRVDKERMKRMEAYANGNI